MDFKYYYKIIGLRGFRKRPLTTILSSIVMVFLNIFKISKTITIEFGSTQFYFSYVPGPKKYGGRAVFLQRRYYEDILEHGDRFVRYGDICIDGGANQGIYTAAFGQYVGELGKVIAVEPMEYAIPHIRNNCALNSLSNVYVVNAALTYEDDVATLDYSLGASTANIVRNSGSTKTCRVTTRTIDSIKKQLELQRIDFIKLDIEGAEENALKGARETISQNTPIIVLEAPKINRLNTIEGLLGKYGYKAYRMCEHTGTLISPKDGQGKNVWFVPPQRRNALY